MCITAQVIQRAYELSLHHCNRWVDEWCHPCNHMIILRHVHRLELRISLICFLSSALNCVDPDTSSKVRRVHVHALKKWSATCSWPGFNHWLNLQYLRGLVLHLEAICIPTQPYEIRVAVAREVPQVWSAILDSSCKTEVIPPCCRLVVNLLQDSDIDVRTNTAISVARMLPGMYFK